MNRPLSCNGIKLISLCHYKEVPTSLLRRKTSVDISTQAIYTQNISTCTITNVVLLQCFVRFFRIFFCSFCFVPLVFLSPSSALWGFFPNLFLCFFFSSFFCSLAIPLDLQRSKCHHRCISVDRAPKRFYK